LKLESKVAIYVPGGFVVDILTALLLALIVVLAHLLFDESGGDGGKFSRAGASV
jgi:hypothetical protein